MRGRGAARRLSARKDIVFTFVGGGSEQERVRDFAETYSLGNIRCIPYQPFAELAATLSAADLHTVVMGDAFVGIVHPSKIYNLVSIGSPFLYVGPADSHITRIAARINGGSSAFVARNGDLDAVVDHILKLTNSERRAGQYNFPELANSFSRTTLLPKMIEILEGSSEFRV